MTTNLGSQIENTKYKEPRSFVVTITLLQSDSDSSYYSTLCINWYMAHIQLCIIFHYYYYRNAHTHTGTCVKAVSVTLSATQDVIWLVFKAYRRWSRQDPGAIPDGRQDDARYPGMLDASGG